MCLLYMSDGFGGDLTTASCLGDALKFKVAFAYSIGALDGAGYHYYIHMLN